MTSRHVTLSFVLVVTAQISLTARADVQPQTQTPSNAPASAPLKKSGKIALLPVVGEGVAADEIERVERTIESEVDAKYGSASLPASEVRARLDESSGRGLYCDRTQTSCLAQLGIVTGSDRVLLPVLAAHGSTSTLTIRVVDVADIDQLAASSASVHPEPTHDEVRALLAKLDAPEARIARLVVRGPDGASVLVDGADHGRLPLADPIVDVAPGKHTITVDGLRRIETVVDVRRGEDAVVDAPALVAAVASEPKDAPPSTTKVTTSTTLPWIGVAGGGAAVLVGAVGLVAGLYPRVQYDDATTRLSKIESETGGDPTQLAARADDVRKARSDLDGAAAAWTTWGEPLAIGASLVVVGGVAAVSAGALGLVE